jgi:sec-independent protein translocase protein TatC
MKLSTAVNRADDEDLFSHTRMSFGDHIEELRFRIIWAIIGFLVALVAGVLVAKPVLDFIQLPVQRQLEQFYDLRIANQTKELDAAEVTRRAQGGADLAADESAKDMLVEMQEEGGTEWKTMRLRFNSQRLVILMAQDSRRFNRPASLVSLTVTEAFMTFFMVSIYCGIVLSSPWLFYQGWMFIGAGLYPHEKKYVYLYLPLSLGLFLGGVALCEFVVLPLGVHYLLTFNDMLGVEPELRLSEWLTFAITMPLIFGAAFQTPIIMLFLERMGIVDITLYTKNRRMAFFILAIAAALMAAAPDALNMMLLAVPLWGLYEFGILLCRFTPRAASDMDEPYPDEMVEG